MIAAIVSLWTASWPLVADHVWQSTLLAAAAALLVRAFARSQARIRHGIWLAASVKFLVPCSLLVAIGSHLGWSIASPLASPGVTLAAAAVGEPFSSLTLADARRSNPATDTRQPTTGNRHPAELGQQGSSAGTREQHGALQSGLPYAGMALLVLWVVGFAAVIVARCRSWRPIAKDLRSAQRMSAGREYEAWSRLWAGRGRPVALLASRTVLEPSVVGPFRPRVLWPLAVSEALEPAQLDAVLIHELSHVRRRDTLSGAVHMAVETIFWFHPLVWWMTSKLVDERERACDEAVLASGAEPHRYAEGLLKVCRCCLESPLPCVPGVTGSNLTDRVERILTSSPVRSLHPGSRLLLGAVAVAIVAGPMAVGAMAARPVLAAPTVEGLETTSGSIAALDTLPPAVVSGVPLTPNRARTISPTSASISTARRRATVASPDAATGSGPTQATPAQTAPTQRAPEVVDVGNGVSMPVLLIKVDPTYTDEALAARIEGEVWLAGVVEPNGTLSNITVSKSLDAVHGLDDAAVAAAKKWRFKPGLRNGAPVRARVQLLLEFRLRAQPAAPDPSDAADAMRTRLQGGVKIDDEFGKGARQITERGVVPPKVKGRVDARYTSDAMRAKLQGVVKMDVVVRADGTVGDARITESLDKTFGLDDAALQAIKVWTFEPGTLDGRPVPVVVAIIMEFRLH